MDHSPPNNKTSSTELLFKVLSALPQNVLDYLKEDDVKTVLSIHEFKFKVSGLRLSRWFCPKHGTKRKILVSTEIESGVSRKERICVACGKKKWFRCQECRKWLWDLCHICWEFDAFDDKDESIQKDICLSMLNNMESDAAKKICCASCGRNDNWFCCYYCDKFYDKCHTYPQLPFVCKPCNEENNRSCDACEDYGESINPDFGDHCEYCGKFFCYSHYIHGYNFNI
jgi:hypothetical protein